MKFKSVIETPPNGKEVIVHERQQDKVSKKFKFDRVFGPSSKQIAVYNAVVSPLLQQVLDGYNCTVFAYGQTGTGKTFTMEGINNDRNLHWQSDSSAGMIPRSLSHLFDKLELIESQEYTVRVSFLELYNEELFDLLSTNDNGSKIRLYDDASKKGAIVIHGLEEVTINNKSEVSKLLKGWLERRQTAPTLLNARSSRSHTLFSITVYMKENTIEGEEVLKTGKLNMVDLAGSENVERSGTTEKRRAREAGNVNRSLLVLGRVITALVNRAPHIPYRESKLTRLLQESLGGRTTTSFIATVSPANINFSETLSTLDYAHRAKNVTNRPEINQKLTKTEFLNQSVKEVERLQKDLLATRERSGVHLTDENYNEMQATISQPTKEIEEKINHIKALEKSMQERENIFSELESENIARREERRGARTKLDTTTDALKATNYRLKVTSQVRDEQKYLVEKHVSTEKVLLAHGHTLLNVADTATTDCLKLHDKIDRKIKAEETFKVRGEQFKRNFREFKQDIEKEISSHGEAFEQFCGSIKNYIGAFKGQCECASIGTETPQMPKDLNDQYSIMANNLTKSIHECYQKYQNSIKGEMEGAHGTMKRKDELLNTISMKFAQDIENSIKIEIARNMQIVRNNLSEKLKRASVQMNEIVNSPCNRHLQSCDRMKTDINSIKVAVGELGEKEQFEKKLDEVCAQFKCLTLTESERKHYVTVTNASGAISKTSNNLKEQIENDLKKVEATVTVGTEKIEELSNRTEGEGKILLVESDSRIDTSYNASKQYQDLIKCNLKEMQQSMKVDKNEHLSVINDMRGAIANQATKISDPFEKISSEFENRIAGSNAWRNKVVGKLDAIASEIDKFLDEDIQRDVPTGETPVRKEFSYPREFTVTSPHERILQRFREMRQLVETAEDEVDES